MNCCNSQLMLFNNQYHFLSSLARWNYLYSRKWNLITLQHETYVHLTMQTQSLALLLIQLFMFWISNTSSSPQSCISHPRHPKSPRHPGQAPIDITDTCPIWPSDSTLPTPTPLCLHSPLSITTDSQLTHAFSQCQPRLHFAMDRRTFTNARHTRLHVNRKNTKTRHPSQFLPSFWVIKANTAAPRHHSRTHFEAHSSDPTKSNTQQNRPHQKP